MVINSVLPYPLAIPSRKGLLHSAMQILCASLLLAILAQIKIPLFFSPVPLTGQTFGVLLIGACLGSRVGALSVLAYIAEGCMGLPVFAGGNSGILYFFGTSTGYLMGFVIQAFLVGKITENQTSFHSVKMFIVMLLSCLIQMSLGTLWLSNFVSWENVLMMGFYPFIPGEVLKSLAVTTYLKFHYSKTIE